MKKFLVLTTLAVLLLVSCLAIPLTKVAAEPTLENADDLIIKPMFSYTRTIRANLTFSGNIADCYGFIDPIGSDNVTIFVVLYRQNGSDWDYVKGWNGSGTGGYPASAGGTYEVTSGTYMVVAYGSVGITLEHPSASITRTLP